MKTNFKFKVAIIESERGWGQKIDEVREFDNYEEAVKFIKDHNAENNEDQVPDIYWRAEPANFTIQKTPN
jgi:hypothetical protein